MDLNTVVNVLFAYGVGLLFLIPGVYMLYHGLVEKGEDLTVQNRHKKVLFGGEEPSAGTKKLYWILGGLAGTLTGLMFIGGLSYVLFLE